MPVEIKLPYSNTGMVLQLDDSLDYEILDSSIEEIEAQESTEEKIVQKALENPIGTEKLCELSKGRKKAVIICSDHTRPVPSKILVPYMIKEIRKGNPKAEITLLVATGCHRDPTPEELVHKFGKKIAESERIEVHHCWDEKMLVNIGKLPSGTSLFINKEAAQADLLVSEGCIEPHFFAGFSGGRKSILPGIAGGAAVLENHCAEFIDSPYSRTGILENNPIHKEMEAACVLAKLQYILNVVVNSEKKIVYAAAGDPVKAHEEGCSFLKRLCQVTPKKKADIVITTNGGYPLDQNMYQSVKGMTAAEAAAKEGAVIIMVSHCGDGHGGENFYKTLAECQNPGKLLQEIIKTPRQNTKPDQWQYQIQSRILLHHKVIYVTCQRSRDLAREMGFRVAEHVSQALEMALEEKGRNAHIAVIPDGVSVIVSKPKAG